jgi:hypothetical protein
VSKNLTFDKINENINSKQNEEHNTDIFPNIYSFDKLIEHAKRKKPSIEKNKKYAKYNSIFNRE